MTVGNVTTLNDLPPVLALNGTELCFIYQFNSMTSTWVTYSCTTGQIASMVAGLSQTYTVAGLPSASVNRDVSVFCSNGRMYNGTGTLEGPGAGTGGLVTSNGTNWRIAGTNQTVQA